MFTVPFDLLLAHGGGGGGSPVPPPHPGVLLIGAAFIFHLGASRLFDSTKLSPERMQRIAWRGHCWHVPRWLVLSLSVTLWALAVLLLMAGIGGMSQ